MIRNWIIPLGTLRFLVIIVLILGVFFRFFNIDHKVYWADEVFTMEKISGYTDYSEVFNNQVITNKDFQNYQKPNPKFSIFDTVKALSQEDPKHTPLYFVIIRSWVEWFGSSVASTRSLSAFISLIVFPCLYWLCLELFQSSLVGWIAVALIAISPFHVLYAQEARMYSLLTVTILLSSAALLRAIHIRTKLSWAIYSITLFLGFYTQSLFGFVVIGHGIYVAFTQGIRFIKTERAYLIASLVGLLTFTPWLFFIITNSNQLSASMEWSTEKIPLLSLIKWWGIHLSRNFLDVIPEYRLDTDISSFNNPVLILSITTILILVIYSIYFVCCHTPKQVWLFLLTLIGVTFLSLALPDLIFGGIRSNNNRYLIASYLGIHLTVAYLLATKLTAMSAKVWQYKFWQFATVAVISCGVVSCAVSSQAETWWNKYYGSEIPIIAKLVNQASSPILIVDADDWARSHTWSISSFLKPQIPLYLLKESNIEQIPEGFSNIFVLLPSEKLQEQIKKDNQFTIQPKYNSSLSLWQIEK